MRYIVGSILIVGIFWGVEKNNLSGTFNYYYISRLSDGSIINLPYRVADIKWQKQDKKVSIYSHLAMEYRIPSDNHFLDNNTSQDFSWDLRELFLTFQLNNAELRLGKQIYSWGMVDGNSPFDVLNAFDYYYLFSKGAEQKIGSLSGSADIYLNNWKLNFYLSPIHQTNRLPINDSESPIELPASPRSSQVISVENSIEFGSYITKSFDWGDIGISYFNGYDRIYNLAGVNLFSGANENDTYLDTLFSYKKTALLGIGGVCFVGDLSIRAEYAFYNSIESNKSITQKSLDRPYLQAISDAIGDSITTIDYSHEFKTGIGEEDTNPVFWDIMGGRPGAQYFQSTVQLEYLLPGDIYLIGQWFQYDTLSLKIDPAPDPSGLPLVNQEEIENFVPEEYFFTGMGAPISSVAKNLIMINFSKKFYDSNIDLNLMSMLDQKDSGRLIEFGVGYELNSRLTSYFAVNKSWGNKSLGDRYAFNTLKDFSHIRMELKYYY